ncbi:circadian-associated transcriptional repressor-like [Cheilinus undulatus]|uniref:circadian-associated transcriptional repressor-like n=1 Tax=Cheilinus undulatus TaxID=241271 RepID=UPI001BD36850|nr:circadian-associated transcriptional repressor-like [Cheilinus undulatus]
MSTSDSDYSIDWLASDEDDYDSSKRLSPLHAAELSVAPSSSLLPSVSPSSPSSSSSSSPSFLRESPNSCSHCGAARRRRWRRSDCRDEGSDSESAPVSLVHGFMSVCGQVSVGAELRLNRKRVHSVGEDGLCETTEADTENELFLLKCSELQCYIAPLSSILQGLRSGRYSQRLSSFQESVAMDRIQRIMGVLQNPHIGGRFLSILLKIEEMLQSWFPHIKLNGTQTDDSPAAKKLKPPHSCASPPPLSDVDSHSSTRLKWLHTSPICSLKTPEPTPPRVAASPSSPLPTQDSAVSSTSDLHPDPPRRLPSAPPRISRGPPPFKIISPCLERLLQAKESIIAPRTAGEDQWAL